jgi:hypothetical protein
MRASLHSIFRDCICSITSIAKSLRTPPGIGDPYSHVLPFRPLFAKKVCSQTSSFFMVIVGAKLLTGVMQSRGDCCPFVSITCGHYA